MKKAEISIQADGLNIQSNGSHENTLAYLDKKLIEISAEYRKCLCVTCKITVINKADDIVSAELYKWFEILEGPISSPHEIESETIDEAIMNIISLQEVIVSINDLRKELLNDTTK